MVSERSKRRQIISLVFILKCVSKKLLTCIRMYITDMVCCSHVQPFFSERNVAQTRESNRSEAQLMVCLLDSRSSCLGLNPGWDHCVVFLNRTLFSHSASLHPGVQMGCILVMTVMLEGIIILQ